MAPEHSIQCDTGNNGCNGGYISRAFQFHVSSGLVPQSCKSYLGTSARRCADKCDDGNVIEQSAIYTMINYSRIHGRTQQETLGFVKDAISTSGSVAASFKVYEHFQSYYGLLNKKDVYKDPDPAERGQFYTYHAIKIIGYNFSANPPYWIIQNSWGTSWADGGYFKLDASLNEDNTEGLEGILDILGDVYQPYVDPYKDECDRFSDCEECNSHAPSGFTKKSTTHVNKDESPKSKHSSLFYSLLHSRRVQKSKHIWREYQDESTPLPPANVTRRRRNDNPQCGYCLSSDKCVSVDENNTPLRGMCEVMAVTSNFTFAESQAFEKDDSSVSYRPCPLDDCASYSNNPLKCVAQKGCHFCAQTNKCKKGSHGQQNSGTCLSPITSIAGFAQNSKYACLFKTYSECKQDSTCAWCTQTNLCLPTSSSSDCVPVIGSCYNTEAADGSQNCSSTASLDSSLSNTYEDFCRHQPCNLCGATNNSNCKWCYTTESCIPDTGACTISSKDITTAFAEAKFPTNQFTRCSQCFNYSSCQDCAVDPECGWLTSVSLCMPGIVNIDTTLTGLPDRVKNDEFITNKLMCPVVYLDDADDDDASGQAKNKTTAAKA